MLAEDMQTGVRQKGDAKTTRMVQPPRESERWVEERVPNLAAGFFAFKHLISVVEKNVTEQETPPAPAFPFYAQHVSII